MSRDYLDRYYTPIWPTKDLLGNHNINYEVLDPCAGDSTMASVLRYHGLNVTTGDIDDYIYEPLDFLWDFITQTDVKIWEGWIVTNPPYRVTEGPGSKKTKYTLADFAKACLKLSPKVALLTRLQWLEDCKDRSDLWRENPPAKILLLPRVEFTDPNGKNVGSGTSMPSIWVIWDDDMTGPTQFIWVDSTKPSKNKNGN